jgi:hypothetical protein
MLPAHSWDTRDLCCLPYIAAASGSAEVDTWPLKHGGCYHVSEVGEPYSLQDVLKVVIENHTVLV